MSLFTKDIQGKISQSKQHGGILDLSDLGLKEIPEEVFEIENLQALRLSSNLISNDDFQNKITVIPKDIQKLKNLEYLQISNNLIKEIPEEILYLKKLKQLNLENNQIVTLPKEICNLPKLVNLQLNKNPIDNVPPEIIFRGVKAIRNFFKELDTYDYLYEVKLLLVGEGRVGKTAISKALTNAYFKLGDEKSTEGINISYFDIPKKELSKGDQIYMQKDNFRFNIWDFGGQEIYHSTHQFFLTKRSLYLLVTESRKEDRYEDFTYWLNAIKLLGDKSPVIIVLNKIDEPTKEIPVGEYKKQFPNIVELIKVSCAQCHKNTIENLKNGIKSIIINSRLLPHIGTKLPKKWVDIREELERLKRDGRDYISISEYYEICLANYVNREGANFLSEFFHDLGVILHFAKDIDLKETVFLNHEWVTKGVYNVLDNKKIITNKGIFEDSDIYEIWADDKYKNKQRELLSLMKNSKFELCFQLEPGKYLAPQLLQVDEKEYVWRTKEKNLKFEYRYKFMPKGILTRLIVKNNHDIYNGTYWRYGVLVEWENTRAIVKEKYLENKIAIQIEGPNKRELLAVLRKSIQEIHDDFGNVEVEEMVPCNCPECTNSDFVFFHEYVYLRRLEQKGIKYERCKHSLLDVNVSSLINDVDKEESEEKNLLDDLIDKSIRMLERKYTKKIEDLYNDEFTDWLRDKGYYATDQTRSGKSLKAAGELDIMIRKENGTPISIIEAFRLNSCNENNKIISLHIDKLLHNYDTAGHKNNYILIYAESPKFLELWQNYVKYINTYLSLLWNS